MNECLDNKCIMLGRWIFKLYQDGREVLTLSQAINHRLMFGKNSRSWLDSPRSGDHRRGVGAMCGAGRGERSEGVSRECDCVGKYFTCGQYQDSANIPTPWERWVNTVNNKISSDIEIWPSKPQVTDKARDLNRAGAIRVIDGNCRGMQNRLS